ncbi:MAG: type IV secretory system conjugative DNA transfer family protein [Acidiferrobacter thiooxydans]
MDDQNVVSGSDINWSSSERPVVSGLCAVIGVAAGYVAGLEGLMWYARQPLTPVREIVPWIWHIVRTYGVVPPVVGGWIPAALAVGLGIACGVGGWRLATRSNVRHIRGFILHRDPRAVARALRPGRDEVPGIRIHPEIQISARQETHHFMVVGGTGAGKTTVLWPWIQQAIARHDRVLIFDSKGDFTQKVPEPFTLLSPTDGRSARWILGHDIRTKLEAQALATTLIQEPPGGSKSDPMWIQGSRALLAGLITDLQARFGEKWDFSHLAYESAAALADYKRLKAIIAREAPLCLALLGGEDAKEANRTTMGFLMQIVSSLTNVIHIGVATHDHRSNPGWSVRGWLAGKTPPTVVLGFRGEQSKELSQAFVASVIERAVRQIGGMPDAAPEKRRIWLCIDEAPEAGRIPSITTSLTTLRSKGTRTLLGFQTLAGVREVHGRDAAQIWEGQVDIKIIGKLGATPDQEWASKLLGDREVERYTHQTTQSNGVVSRSGSWQRMREPLLMPSAFGQELGMQKDRRGRLQGPRALVIAGGQAAVLDWPLTPRTVLRDPVIDARWIQPGYKAPAWGKDPPAVAPEIAGSLPQKSEDPKGPKREKDGDGKAKPSPNMMPTSEANKPAQNVGTKKPDPDPFGDLVGGILADTLLPGASVIMDAANTAGDATTAPAPGDTLPPTPGISEPEGDEAGHQEPEPGD